MVPPLVLLAEQNKKRNEIKWNNNNNTHQRECLLRVQLYRALLLLKCYCYYYFFSVLFCLVCLFFFVFFSYFSFHPVAECTHEFVHGRIGHSLLNFLRHSDPQATPTNGEAPKLDTNTEESGPAVNASLSCVVSVSVRARLQSMGGRRR